MKRKLLVIGLPALLLAMGGIWWGAAARTGPPPVGRFETVERGEVSIKVTETGTIEPLKKVEIKSKVAGRVARLLAPEGTQVRAGDLLAEIDPTEINSQVEQMRAQRDGARARFQHARRGTRYQTEQTQTGIEQARQALRAAQARLAVAEEEYRAQPRRTRSDIAQAQANFDSARNNLQLLQTATQPQAVVQTQTGFEEAQTAADNARRSLERNQKLLAKGFVSEQVVDTAGAEVAAANARRDQAKKRLDLTEAQNRLEVAQAQSRVAQAQAALERARTDQSLVPIKQQELLSARSAVAQARAQLRGALAGTEQDQMRGDEVAEAQAVVLQLENQLREVEVRQRDTRLRATMNGVVTRRYVEEGELVTSGVNSFGSGTPILQIADLSQMLIRISVNEVDVAQIRPGLPVEIAIDGVRGAVWAGRVYTVAPAAQTAGAAGQNEAGASSGTGSSGVIRFTVEVLVARPDARLRPGMSGRCTILIARRPNVLRLPNSSLEGNAKQTKIQVVTQTTKDGKTQNTTVARAVTLGLRGDNHTEIVSGLRAGERVKPGAYAGPPRKGVDIFD